MIWSQNVHKRRSNKMDLSNDVFGMQVAFFFDEGSNISILDFAGEIKELYKAMFPDDPQILPLPSDAPPEVPRCIFQKEDASARLSFSQVRMDFNAGLKDGRGWKNNYETIIYTFVQICKKFNVSVRRIGLVIQASTDTQFGEEVNKLVNYTSFKQSQEKSIFWVDKTSLNGKVEINVVNNIQINNNLDKKSIVTLDVNTSNESSLSCTYRELLTIGSGLLSELEERLKNVLRATER